MEENTMVFADKLIQLRRQHGWSQEELAEKMDVTRQAVSKWESAQSVPEPEKIVRLSELFGVSTDYLLKNQIEPPDMPGCSVNPIKRVSIEEAQTFLRISQTASQQIPFAVLLCILSPICLLLLGAASTMPSPILSDRLAVVTGMSVLLVLVAIAVAIFISWGNRFAPYEYLKKESFEPEYGLSSMVRERMAQFQPFHTRYAAMGVCICILSLIPFFFSVVLRDENTLGITALLSATLALAGIGVFLLLRGGILWSGFQKLLQEGDYTKIKKENRLDSTAITVAFWLTATAVYIGYSYATENWSVSWVIWAVAGVMYPAVIAFVRFLWSLRK